MKYYKELLLKKLSDSNWEVVEKDDDTDWWAESCWKLKSIRRNYGKTITIIFLVDPQYDGVDKSRAIWAIGAFDQIPIDRPSEDGILTVNMIKGKLDQQLTLLVKGIDSYRDKRNS